VSDLDRAFKRIFDDDDPTVAGSGWWSGAAAVFCGFLAVAGVACFLFPDWLTTPEVRARLPLAWARAILQAVIVLAFVLGLVSTALRRRKVLGLLGMSLASIASILKHGLDKAYATEPTPDLPPIRHGNIRGTGSARLLRSTMDGETSMTGELQGQKFEISTKVTGKRLGPCR